MQDADVTIGETLPPLAEAGNNEEVCINSSVTISSADTQNVNGFTWFLDPLANGVLNNSSTLTPTYVPASGDEGISISLTLTAHGIGNCSDDADNMTITVFDAVTANAGSDAAICENSAYTVNDASVTNGNGTYNWTHNGNGTLADANTLNPTYTAVAADAGNIVTLTLTAQGNADCADDTDQMDITIEHAVVANAGSDATICENSAYTVNDASVTNGNGTYNWTHNGNGTLADANTLNPTYTAVAADAGNIVTLTLTAQGNADCADDTDQMDITIEHAVVANAGSDAAICENSAYTVNDASVTNGNGTYNWTHNGNGTLADANTLTPTYTAVAADAGNIVTLTLTAQGNADCADDTDQMDITIEHAVVADAGSDASICVNSAYTVNNASITNGNGTFTWSHDGNGSLTDANTLTPTYTPVAADIGSTITLTLTAQGNADCADDIDNMTITVFDVVTANAGSDAAICENSAYTVNDASVTNGNGTYNWTHNGNGTLTDANTLTPTYTTVAADAGNIVTLTLTAQGNADCADDTDQMDITIEHAVVANAGSDAAICENSAYTVNDASVTNGNGTYNWTHNGNGTLTDANTLNPTYTAVAADAGNIVTLTLTAQGNADCADDTDQMDITIEHAVAANAGSDATICENSAYTVNDASVTNGNGTYNWTHNGNGTLADANTLNPTYTAVAADAGNIVTLTLTAQGNADCADDTDQMDITIEHAVAANAGSDATICENSAYTVNDASVTNGNGTYNWTHNGNGTLADANTLNPTYTAVAADAGNIVTLTLTAQGNADCADDTDQMDITIEHAVVADAGSDASICVNSAYTVNNASITNGNGTFTWSHDGNGSLTDASTLTPTYTPVAADIGSTITLTLTAQGNADCADDIDNMTITVFDVVTANAGSDAAICENSAYTVNDASVTNGNGTYNWTHNGNGTLTDANTLTPTYTAVAADAGNIVTLTLTAQGNADCADDTDQMDITIEHAVVANAGSDAAICENSAYTVNDASVTNGNGTYNWTHNGNGTLADANTLTPTYTAVAADAGNIVTLTLTAQGNADCADDTDQMDITIEHAVAANAGSDATICENSAYTVNDASVTNGNGTYNWTHNGNGTLADANTLNPTYTAVAADAGNIVTLTLTAQGNADCADDTDQMDITIEHAVAANAGSDATICENSAYTVNDASVTNGNGTYNWTHNGNGTLADANTLTPTYTAVAADAGNIVTLTLTAQGNADCADDTDQMDITIEHAVVADAGSDASICVNSAYTVNNASITNGNGTFTWSHDGNGSLTDASTLTPTYTPVAADIGSTITLTLTAQGNADCADDIDNMTITVFDVVTANAGSDAAICENSAYTVNDASVTNGNGTYNWTHNGNGTLTDANTLTPTYTAVAADAGNIVTLTLTAQGNADCADDTDQMDITIEHAVVANAGSDAAI